jgi:hypothetical protein
MISNSEDNSANGNLTVSLREFPRQGNLTTGVERFPVSWKSGLTCDFMQRGQNIAIQINTRKEFVPDLMNNQGKDMDKTEVERDSRI